MARRCVSVWIGLVKVGDVPKHRLVAAGGGRLVQAVDYLLKGVGDDLVDGTPARGEVGGGVWP